ncbi:MAG: restriction endonuclease subunit S [Deltaproteobacteria bacterium CG11_big_fil_rev_8_21_14_0_20_47_16]|nr:MAG: restriction endonuclease subunit S [Deltaproteobacteria bacterium CG11_big_fil_rev_8_21_14_0_20_47_16]
MVKSGYKQTEVGVIPEEWSVRPLLSTVRIANGQVSPKVEPYKSMILVAPDHIESSTGRLLARQTATEQRAISGKYVFESGDIVYSKIRPYLRKAILANFVGLCSADMYPLKPAADVSSEFMLSIVLGYRFSKYAESVSVRSGMPKINRMELAEFSLGLPPIPEQRAIATALSDVDGLLGALERLIAKKRDLKQAAMQQLLTGKKRLPGFQKKWDVKRLGEVFSISAGKSKSAYVVTDGHYWVVDMGSVSRSGRLIVSKGTNYQGDFLKVGDLVMPKDDIGGGNIIGKVGYIDADDTYVLGDHVYCLKANVGDPLFLSYVINGHQTNIALRKKVIGSAQLGLGRKSVEEQEIPFPHLSEQTAIADVLSDMDAEIVALEQRRVKTRALKQGMMQELLTGKTRLVTPEVNYV